jgi:hypothetical protein
MAPILCDPFQANEKDQGQSMLVVSNYYKVFSFASNVSFVFNASKASKASMDYYNNNYTKELTKELELHSRLNITKKEDDMQVVFRNQNQHQIKNLYPIGQ